MTQEIELIQDGDGLAVIGDSSAVERFLATEQLPSRDLGLHRLGPALMGGSAALQAVSQISESSGRWVKLTRESAALKGKYSLMAGSQGDLARAVVTDKGKIKGILEIVPGAKVNPAMLAGAAGLMAQLAMQQTMDEITDYLATIDQKVDDLLRAQKDSVVAEMIGVDFVVEEAMTIREAVGKVSEVTWSKVQGTSMAIARTQGYTLRQLDALAEKMERTTKLGDLAKTTSEAERAVREWLAILARCFQLQDAIAILELDRVLDAAPDELSDHRRGLTVARQNRRELIAKSSQRLLRRMDAAATDANSKVLLHPATAPAIVRASNEVAGAVSEFQRCLGIDDERQALEARAWGAAASEARDKVLRTGADGVDAARSLGSEGIDAARTLGSETLGRAKAARGKLASGLAERVSRRRGGDDEVDPED